MPGQSRHGWERLCRRAAQLAQRFPSLTWPEHRRLAVGSTEFSVHGIPHGQIDCRSRYAAECLCYAPQHSIQVFIPRPTCWHRLGRVSRWPRADSSAPLAEGTAFRGLPASFIIISLSASSCPLSCPAGSASCGLSTSSVASIGLHNMLTCVLTLLTEFSLLRSTLAACTDVTTAADTNSTSLERDNAKTFPFPDSLADHVAGQRLSISASHGISKAGADRRPGWEAGRLLSAP